MNHAARIVYQAQNRQLLCSGSVWEQALAQAQGKAQVDAPSSPDAATTPSLADDPLHLALPPHAPPPAKPEGVALAGSCAPQPPERRLEATCVGDFTLKGVPTPVALFAVTWADDSCSSSAPP